MTGIGTATLLAFQAAGGKVRTFGGLSHQLYASPGGAAVEARSSFGSTASVVAPCRSRATITGICSADTPRLLDLPPLLRNCRRRPDRLLLNDSRMNVLSRSTMAANAFALRRSPLGLASCDWSNQATPGT
jgi:hypothetical protein